MGAFYNATNVLIGTPGTTRGFFYEIIEKNKEDYKNGARYKSHYEYDYKTVIKYNENYAKYIEKEKKKIGENSDEFQMSYCLKWLFERGMFIDPDKFPRLANESAERCFNDMFNMHVVGIDLGKSQDSTVVTVGEVDLENPVIVEENKEKNIPGYTMYAVKVKDWLEIQGDNWDEQYFVIKDYLTNFRIHKIVMDATGVGSAIYDRLNNAVSCEIVPYVFGLQSKSDLYKHFDNVIKEGHYTYPADLATQETPEYRNFKTQMLDAEKTYNGQNMVVKHPARKGAHDDYPDSSALMVWAAKGELITPESANNNPFLEKKSQEFYNIRNRITGRRR